LIVWIDAQLPPALAPWIIDQFAIEALSVRKPGLQHSKDLAIFEAARAALAVVITKDSDFVVLQNRLGSPPKVIWVRCGNTSNAHLRELFERVLARAFALLEEGEELVEISEPG